MQEGLFGVSNYPWAFSEKIIVLAAYQAVQVRCVQP